MCEIVGQFCNSMNWREQLIDDVCVLVLSHLDWGLVHRLALTEKWALALVMKLRDQLFGPGVPLAVPHGALHPLSLLAHGHTHDDPDVKKHKWQWDDLEDLVQFRGGWIFAQRLLDENAKRSPPLEAHVHRTTVTNMKVLFRHPLWKECFSGHKGLHKVAKVGNIELLRYFLTGDVEMRRDLSWPVTTSDFLWEVILSGNVALFQALWSLNLCTFREFSDSPYPQRGINNYDAFKVVRSMGIRVTARIDSAIESGEIEYLLMALGEDHEERNTSHPYPLVTASVAGRQDMVDILRSHGFTWPSLSCISDRCLAECMRHGFDPFFDVGYSLEFSHRLVNVVSEEIFDKILQQCPPESRKAIKRFRQTMRPYRHAQDSRMWIESNIDTYYFSDY